MEKHTYGDVVLEYNNEEYKITYIKGIGFAIGEKDSDEVIHVFKDELKSLLQYDTDNKTHFITIEIDEENNKNLNHYFYIRGNDGLLLEDSYECRSTKMDKIRVGEHSFIVKKTDYSDAIYNLKRESKDYLRIYNDKRISEIIGDNILMVSEYKQCFLDGRINDTLTYGINPTTFDIVTPIWSDLQQRYIDIYTEEQAAEIVKNSGRTLDRKKYSLGDITIMYEVTKYLTLLSEYYEKSQGLYLECSEINKEFVKKFVKSNS